MESNKEKITHFELLNGVNVNDKTEKKNNGSTDLTYLSWCWAWTEVKKRFPNADYQILKFGENKLPYVYDESTGFMVFTIVEIEGVEHEMWLPVMDSANKAMLKKPYTYKVKKYDYDSKTRRRTFNGQYDEKRVEAATMFDVNKTIMRCLTKNLAMFGLGLYIYAGEDLPEDLSANDEEIEKETKKTKTKKTDKKEDSIKKIMIQPAQIEKIKSLLTEEQLKPLLEFLKKDKVEDLTLVEASGLIKKFIDGGK